MSTARSLMMVTAVLEGILAIPLLGGIIVMGLYYVPLGIMFVIHIVALVFALKEKVNPVGSIMGIVTSLIAWIPLVGWVMHLITGVILLVIALTSKSKIEHHNHY